MVKDHMPRGLKAWEKRKMQSKHTVRGMANSENKISKTGKNGIHLIDQGHNALTRQRKGRKGKGYFRRKGG